MKVEKVNLIINRKVINSPETRKTCQKTPRLETKDNNRGLISNNFKAKNIKKKRKEINFNNIINKLHTQNRNSPDQSVSVSSYYSDKSQKSNSINDDYLFKPNIDKKGLEFNDCESNNQQIINKLNLEDKDEFLFKGNLQGNKTLELINNHEVENKKEINLNINEMCQQCKFRVDQNGNYLKFNQLDLNNDNPHSKLPFEIFDKVDYMFKPIPKQEIQLKIPVKKQKIKKMTKKTVEKSPIKVEKKIETNYNKNEFKQKIIVNPSNSPKNLMSKACCFIY